MMLQKFTLDFLILVLTAGCASAPHPVVDEPNTATEPSPSPMPHPPTRLDAPDTRDSGGLAVPQQFSEEQPAPAKTSLRECAFEEFAEELLEKETPDPFAGQAKLLGDINGDDLPDYSVEYADQVVSMSWIFVQQPQGECWREVYEGAGSIQVGTHEMGGWKTLKVPFVANSMAGPNSPEYATGTARAEYDATKSRYVWKRAVECADGAGKALSAKRCQEVFEQLKPKE